MRIISVQFLQKTQFTDLETIMWFSGVCARGPPNATQAQYKTVHLPSDWMTHIYIIELD